MTIQVASDRRELLSPARVPHLSDSEREQVADFLARLQEACPNDVQRVVLYGSKARGEAAQWSDIDLLVVAASGYKGVKQICKDFEDSNSLIAPMVFSLADWENYQRLKLPFYVNMRRDGIELWDEYAAQREESLVRLDFPEGELRPLDFETIEVIRLYVAESREMWRNAQVIKNDGRSLYAVPSAYRAAYSLATAAL